MMFNLLTAVYLVLYQVLNMFRESEYLHTKELQIEFYIFVCGLLVNASENLVQTPKEKFGTKDLLHLATARTCAEHVT